MNKPTLKALKESIAHWERLASGDRSQDDQLGPRNCALCKLFYIQPGCISCPVMEKTGKPYCKGTPYDAVIDCQEALVYNNKIPDEASYTHPLFLAEAKKELAFLKSLLPTTKTLTSKAVKKQTKNLCKS